MAVTVIIIGVLSWLAMDTFRRVKPAASLDSAAADLHSWVHFARQEALSTGKNVAVLVFPGFKGLAGTGRFILLEDEPESTGLPSFFDSGAPRNFANCDPAFLKPTPNGKVLDIQDLSYEVGVGPKDGNGQLAGLPFPYNSIQTNVPCSFCTGSSGNGAIVFDARGRVSFYSTSGADIEPTGQAAGASLTLYGTTLETDLKAGGTPYHTSTLIVTAPFGFVRTFWHGEDKR